MPYVYAYLDPRQPGSFCYADILICDFQPFYIGKGRRNRHNDHLRYAKSASERGKARTRFIQEMLAEGVTPMIVKVREDLSEEDATDLEALLIRTIGISDEGGCLRQKMKRNSRGPGDNGLLGKHHTEATKERISSTSKGHKKSDAFRRRISELKKGQQTMLGKKHKPGVIEERQKRQVLRVLKALADSAFPFSEENFNKCRTKYSPMFQSALKYFSPDELYVMYENMLQKMI